jgi:hypothetical protein
MLMLKRKNDQSPFPDPPGQTELSQFHKTKQGGPSPQDFRLDFLGTNRSPWNKKAASVFAVSFLAAHPKCQKDPKAVATAFQTHLITIKSNYLKMVDDFDVVAAHHVKQIQARRSRLRTVSISCHLAFDSSHLTSTPLSYAKIARRSRQLFQNYESSQRSYKRSSMAAV